MQADIQTHLFIEAGETYFIFIVWNKIQGSSFLGQYNENLYGTSVQSVQDVAAQVT